MAPVDLWWQALTNTFAPPPEVITGADWHTWAADIDYTPAPEQQAQAQTEFYPKLGLCL